MPTRHGAPPAATPGRRWSRPLLAAAHHRRGRDAEALAFLRLALTIATPGNLRAPLLAYGEHLRGLLERHLWELGAWPLSLALLEDLRSQDPVDYVETLTEREQAVLAYLPTLMSNAEIAREMLVSVNTVKTHLKAAYRKLGVERRRDALLRARQLELM